MLYAKFGRGIAEKFLVPYNEKLYATDLATLDVDAMGRFFPYANEDEIVRNFRTPDNASYNATFTYPEGGAIQYVHALAAYVEIGYPKDAPVDDGVIERMRGRVLEDLERAGLVSGHELLSSHAIVMDPAYVHITRRSLEDFAAKKRVLESRGVYSIGRYGGWTYCSIEDNVVEARALADALTIPWRS